MVPSLRPTELTPSITRTLVERCCWGAQGIRVVWAVLQFELCREGRASVPAVSTTCRGLHMGKLFLLGCLIFLSQGPLQILLRDPCKGQQVELLNLRPPDFLG